MPRRREVPKRVILPDPKYGSEMLAKFEKEGVALRVFDKTMLDAFAKASKEVLAEESAKDPMFKKTYDSMAAFQEKNRKWHALGYLPRDHK